MTADWRATLERVAEKLAEAKGQLTGPTSRPVEDVLDEGSALVRGLLAEPQVNPSEAREDDEVQMRLVAEPLFAEAVAQGMHSPFGLNCEYWGREYASKLLDAWRAGLLAEGEESRKP